MTGSELKVVSEVKLSPAGSRQKNHLLVGDDCKEEEDEKKIKVRKLQLLRYSNAVATRTKSLATLGSTPASNRRDVCCKRMRKLAKKISL